MRVKINPDTHNEEVAQLSIVLCIALRSVSERVVTARLIEILVEKGALTLADCQEFGAPHMEKVE